MGITDPAQKAKLGAMTRERKSRSLLMPELKEFWFGGLSEEEVELAESLGAEIFGLGPRTLRAETAALAAVALIQYEFGSL